MKIQVITCQVGLRQKPEHSNFALTVGKVGPTAIRVSEVPILQMLNGMDSVFYVAPAKDENGEPIFAETLKAAEWERLQKVYKPNVVKMVYPTPSIPMPKTIEDLDLEKAMIRTDQDEAYMMRQELKSLGVKVHPATGIDKLRAMLADATQDAA